MSPFPLPALLRDAVAADGSPDRRAWLAGLPVTVRALAERWVLTVGEPFEPGGEVSWVAPARDVQGRDLVLKVGWRHEDGEHEAAGLRAWRGRGAVEVYDTHTDGSTTALLLERCVPGTPLGELLPGPGQDEVVSALLRGLWHEPPAGHPFRSLTAMCDRWADEFDARSAADPDLMDPGLARAGMELYRGLPRSAGHPSLLVTDLHAGNILDGGARGWRLIDPKPHVGDPCYDVIQHLLNQPDRLVAAPRAAAARMAALTDLDPERVELWLFARCVQELPDTTWLLPVASELGRSVRLR